VPLGYDAYALALPLLLMVIMNLMIRPWRTVLAVAALPLVLASCAVAARSGKVITESRPASSFIAAELTGRLAYRIESEDQTAGRCRRRDQLEQPGVPVLPLTQYRSIAEGTEKPLAPVHAA